MADVQLEHGHVRIANRLYEALLDAEFSPTQFKIMHGLIRLSYGWGRRTVTISHAELAHAINMAPSGAFRAALRELVVNGAVVLVDAGGGSNKATYAVQKDYAKWGALSMTAERLKARFGVRPESHDELLDGAQKKADGVPGSSQGECLEDGTGTGSKSLIDETVRERKDIESKEPSTSTPASGANGYEDSRIAAAVRLVVAANAGLHDHPKCPQMIPRITPGQPGTLETMALLDLNGVPFDFAEMAIHKAAMSHNAGGEVRTLKYFAEAVVDAWKRHCAGESASRFRRPTPAATAKQLYQYPAGTDPDEPIRFAS